MMCKRVYKYIRAKRPLWWLTRLNHVQCKEFHSVFVYSQYINFKQILFTRTLERFY